MADGTKIEWTDATWNPVTGCTVVSEGCRNCYAMRLAGTRLAHTESRAGLTRQTADGRHVWNGQVRFNEQWLDQPLRWKRPRMVFVCAHGDLFAEGVPDEWIDRVFAVMALAPQHVFQVLTKRPGRMREYLAASIGRIADAVQPMRTDTRAVGPLPHLDGGTPWWPLPNVWLGVSVEDQATADARIPFLLGTPAAIRWISAEPLLGPVDLRQIHGFHNGAAPQTHDALSGYSSDTPWGYVASKLPDPFSRGRLDWVVVGGESGPGARPMHPDWARSLRDQCAAAGVPFFFKQWGEWAPEVSTGGEPLAAGELKAYTVVSSSDRARVGAHVWHAGQGPGQRSITLDRVGKVRGGRTLDGTTHDATPEVAA